MAAVGISHHAEERARQRGFRHKDLELVMELGTPIHDGFLLTGSDVERFECAMKQELRKLRRLRCTFVAITGDTVMSVYRPDGPKRRRLFEEALA